MIEEEKKLIVYYEVGYVFVVLYQLVFDLIYKVIIILCGCVFGMVMCLLEKDQVLLICVKCKVDFVVVMGGCVVEEMIFGYEKVMFGVFGDIQMVIKLVWVMVMQFGMFDKFGLLFYGENQEEVFFGYLVVKNQYVFDEIQKIVDVEIKFFVNQGYEIVQKILGDYEDQLYMIV